MKKIILLSIFIFSMVCMKGQAFTISKTDCNFTFTNFSSSKVWYSYDLLEAVITYNPANDVKQFIISDNKRSNTFTITQITNYSTIPIIIDSFYSWKNDCITLHK